MDLNAILGSVTGFFANLPPFAGAIAIFVSGWILAKLGKFLVPRLMRLVRIDRASEKTGLSAFLKKGGVLYPPSTLTGIIIFWTIMVVALSRTVARLDAGAAESISDWIAEALPTFIVTLIGITIGIVVTVFISNFSMTIARNAAVRNPKLIGKSIRYVGYLLVATMSLERLGFGQTVVSTLLLMVVAAGALAIGLAFGLGCKDMARKSMEDFLMNLREKERSGAGGDLEG